MRALLLAACLALCACSPITREVTPGLSLTCAPRCHLSPANLHHSHAPGERDDFLPDPRRPK